MITYELREDAILVSKAADIMGVKSGYLYVTLTSKGKEFLTSNLRFANSRRVRELCEVLDESDYFDSSDKAKYLPVPTEELNFWHAQEILSALRRRYIKLLFTHRSDELSFRDLYNESPEGYDIEVLPDLAERLEA